MSAYNTNPVQALLNQTSLKTTAFSSTSRYFGIDTAAVTQSNAHTVTYVLRRFLPQPQAFQVIEEHTVVKGDRLDNLAQQYFGDATLFWRLADANRAMRAEDLTATPGKTLVITLPEAVSGSFL